MASLHSVSFTYNSTYYSLKWWNTASNELRNLKPTHHNLGVNRSALNSSNISEHCLSTSRLHCTCAGHDCIHQIKFVGTLHFLLYHPTHIKLVIIDACKTKFVHVIAQRINEPNNVGPLVYKNQYFNNLMASSCSLLCCDPKCKLAIQYPSRIVKLWSISAVSSLHICRLRYFRKDWHTLSAIMSIVCLNVPV